jgi:hypothetical protein
MDETRALPHARLYDELVFIEEYAKSFNQQYLHHNITEFYQNPQIHRLLLSVIPEI